MNGRLVVVDGRQRLTTLLRFISGELSLNLEDRKELHGKTFSQLHPRLQNRVEDCQLLFYIIDYAVPERARLDIFERVNGGEVLTRQQMRNAIHNGPATAFLREEASTELFKMATGGSLNVNKMQDREFVNRFVSFSLLPLDAYKGDMDKWLADGLTRLARMTEDDRDYLRLRFQRSLGNNHAVFGKHSFRKHYAPDQARSVLNASLFDVLSVGLADKDDQVVHTRAHALRTALYERLRNVAFVKAITYGPNTPKEVRTRFAIAKEMLQEVFGAE